MTVIGRWGKAAGTVVLALALAQPTATSASASAVASDVGPGRTRAALEIPPAMRAQIPLSQAAKVIRTEVERSDPGGYAGIELGDGQVVLWWKGTMSAPVAKAIGKARSVAPVRVRAAAHSLRELRAAGGRIRAAWADAKPRIAYAVDGSAVRVAVPAAVARRAMPKVDVPVDVVGKATKVLASRVDDWPPWAGGADQINGNSRCTTGFPVQSSGGTEWILTAGHCGSNGNRITDGTGEFMGWFGNDRDDHDIALVQVSGGADPWMYAGDANSNGVFHVDGWDWVYPGELLCQSGGTSARVIGGPVCNLRVEKFNTDPGDAVEARQIDGQTAVRGGDSGGPVYSYSASGGVIAKGINNYTYIGAEHILGFQDFGTATRDYGVWIAG